MPVENSSAPTPSGQVPQVDSRIEVFWPDDAQYYAGVVVSMCDEGKNTHVVQYDDGDWERINLRRESWRALPPVSSPSNPTADVAAPDATKLGAALASRAATASNEPGEGGVTAPVSKPTAAASSKVDAPTNNSEADAASALTPPVVAPDCEGAAAADSSARPTLPNASPTPTVDRVKIDSRLLATPSTKAPVPSAIAQAIPSKVTSAAKKPSVPIESLAKDFRASATGTVPSSAKGKRIAPSNTNSSGPGATVESTDHLATRSSDARQASGGNRMDVDGANVTEDDDDDDDVTLKPQEKVAKPADKRKQPGARMSPTGRGGRGGGRGKVAGTARTGKRRRMESAGKGVEGAGAIGNDQARSPVGPVMSTVAAGQEIAQGGGSPGGDGGGVLPLDHVMTAVVQATVLILDQRLRPIADRLDSLTDEIRQSREASRYPSNTGTAGAGPVLARGPPADVGGSGALANGGPNLLNLSHLAQMVTQQHAEHVDQIDRLRREMKKLRAEHRSVIGETVAMKEVELRQYLEKSLHHAVEGAVTNGPTVHEENVDLHNETKNRTFRTSHAEHAALEGNVDQVEYDAQGYGTLPLSPNVTSNAKALQLVARQVTVWLLETQHECHDIDQAREWAKDIASTCFIETAEKLRVHSSYSLALAGLVRSLGDDNAELGWFLNPSDENSLRVARENYSAWEPPPNDDEWVVEEYLLSELAMRFHRALESYDFRQSTNDLLTAIDLSLVAAQTREVGETLLADDAPHGAGSGT